MQLRPDINTASLISPPSNLQSPLSTRWILSQQRAVSYRNLPRFHVNPLTPLSELLNIHNAFHSGQYQNVIDFDTAALSSENQLPARVLKLRAQIALGQAKEVIAAVSSEEDTPDLAATKAFAQQTAGNTDAALQLAQDLAENYPENATVQVLGGTVLQAHGNSEEALALLSKHQGNLEA